MHVQILTLPVSLKVATGGEFPQFLLLLWCSALASLALPGLRRSSVLSGLLTAVALRRFTPVCRPSAVDR